MPSSRTSRVPGCSSQRRTHSTSSAVAAGSGPAPYVDALLATAEEVECVLRWLELPGTRLVRLEGTWASPVAGAGRHRGWIGVAEQARAAARPLDDTRGLRPGARPARVGV